MRPTDAGSGPRRKPVYRDTLTRWLAQHDRKSPTLRDTSSLPVRALNGGPYGLGPRVNLRRRRRA